MFGNLHKSQLQQTAPKRKELNSDNHPYGTGPLGRFLEFLVKPVSWSWILISLGLSGLRSFAARLSRKEQTCTVRQLSADA